MKYHDYYKTLEVERDATQEQIAKSYRKLARKYHPDVNKSKGAEDKFKELSEANEVLKDPETRKRYDALGANWKQGQDFRPPPEWADMFSSFSGFGAGPGGASGAGGGRQEFNFGFGDGGGGGYSDFFDALLGGASPFGRAQGRGSNNPFMSRGSQQPTRGRDHEAEITIGIRDAYYGTTQRISFEVTEPNGHAAARRTTKSYQIKIPPGTVSGNKIRLTGQGEPGSNGTPGNLLLKINVQDDQRYLLRGHDIVTTLALAPWEAALGAKVPVETLDGTVTLSVPAGSQNGAQLRLRGKGFPKKDNVKGDMLVELKISVPKKLSKAEKKLFEKLSEVSDFKPREGG